MATDAFVSSNRAVKLDYSLTGVNSTLAVEKGLAEADWYQCPVPRETMRKLAGTPRRARHPRHHPLVCAYLRRGYATWRSGGLGGRVLPT